MNAGVRVRTVCAAILLAALCALGGCGAAHPVHGYLSYGGDGRVFAGALVGATPCDEAPGASVFASTGMIGLGVGGGCGE